MEEQQLIEIAVVAGAVVLGLIVGNLIGRSRARPADGIADWKMRLAARDRDLSETVDRLLEAELALQDAMKVRASTGDIDAAARIEALTEELAETEDELARLRSLGVDKGPAQGSVARRLETLEAELATLESLRCPDPSAHRRAGSAGATADERTDAA